MSFSFRYNLKIRGFFSVASDETMPGFTAVGKNVMVLKEHQVIALKYLARIL